MSEIKVFNSSKKEILKSSKYALSEITDVVKDNAFPLFGVNIIGENISLMNNPLSNDDLLVSLLGYDEQFKIVIFEFRKDRFGSLVKSGFMAIDYVKENVGKIKVLLKNYLTAAVVNNLNLNSRLIIIGEDFSSYDEYAIKQTPYEVDLIKIRKYRELYVLEKIYQSFKVKIAGLHELRNPVFIELHNEIMALGDEINASGTSFFVCYRKIKNICYIMIENDKVNVTVRIGDKFNNFENITKKDISQIMKSINKAYEEN